MSDSDTVNLKALPYYNDSPDSKLKLAFQWFKEGLVFGGNENVVSDNCIDTYYTCKIFKDGEYFFSVYQYLKLIGKL